MDPQQLAQQLMQAQQQTQQQQEQLAQAQQVIQQLQQQMQAVQIQMQNPPAAAPAPQPQAPAPKLPKPSLFTGERPTSTLQPWLVQLKTHLAATPHMQLDSHMAVNTAAAYLGGSALIWYDTQKTDNAGVTPFEGWEQFATALTQHYLPMNLFANAFGKLLKLQQTNSVQNYVTRFNELLLSLHSMDPTSRLRMFLEGLKHEVRLQVEIANPPDLKTAQDLAIRTDNIQYQSRPQQHYKPRHTPGPSTGPTPMELGAHTMDPPSGQYNALKCYNCNEEGHYARDCPRPARQQNGRGRGRGRYQGSRFRGRGRGRSNNPHHGAPN